MHVEQAATKARAATSLARDGGLEVRLEGELPNRLAVGRGNAVFVYGTCFHPLRRVRAVELVAQGRRSPAIAHGMPRRDLFEAGLPYRSAFWGIVPFAPVPESRTVAIRVEARLDDGSTEAAEPAAIELVRGPALEPVQPPAGGDGGPLVAICMATYEPRPQLLRRQIDSIRKQTHRNWVCAISDDCSSEASLAELRSAVEGDSRFVISSSPRRLGFYSNFERALSMAPAGAAFIALADQDDRWHPDKLERLVASIGSAGLAYSDARVVREDGTLASPTYWTERRPNHTDLASLLITNTVTGAASLFRRELLDRALPFPPQLGTQWHDHWLALVALARGEIAYVDRPLYDYVQHGAAVVGHSAANPRRERRPWAERVRILREDWRAAFAGWCWKYFHGVCGGVLFARVLEMRTMDVLTPRKRRAVRLFAAIDRSAVGLAWLAARRLRRLGGRDQTLGAERLLAQGLAWRRLLALLTWRRQAPPPKLRKDATLPHDSSE